MMADALTTRLYSETPTPTMRASRVRKAPSTAIHAATTITETMP